LKPFVYFFRLIIVIYFIILLKEEANTDKQDLVVYIIGGDCCPKQNIQLDLFNGKLLKTSVLITKKLKDNY